MIAKSSLCVGYIGNSLQYTPMLDLSDIYNKVIPFIKKEIFVIENVVDIKNLSNIPYDKLLLLGVL